MLLASSTKTAQANSVAEMVAAYKASGGMVIQVETGVANGLKKKKFVRK